MTPEAHSLPRQKATTYPVLGKIIAEVRFDDAGNCQMPAERFGHWARVLGRRYPHAEHPELYQMLGGMSLEFARYRAFAAVQLYALATLGLPVDVVEELADKSEFLREARARADTLNLSGAPRARPPGILPPQPSGVSIRPKNEERN